MTKDQFFNEYVPSVLNDFFRSKEIDRLEAEIPDYVPFLQGCRYSLEQMTASFSGLTLETTRGKMLLALLKGNAIYQGHHLREVASLVRLSGKAMVTGGGAKIGGFLQVKKRWTGDFEYQYQDQSSLLGAAMLGQLYQKGIYT
jgi:sugar (pentulose or hexulose) kinase